MSSIWKLNGADIYVDEYAENLKPQIAELNPIDSTASIFHYIFTPDQDLTVAGTVIGSGYIQTIKNGLGTNVTLITDLVPGGITVLLEDLKIQREQYYAQRVDQSQSETAPVYRVAATLRAAN
jgi:hypothetical protein